MALINRPPDLSDGAWKIMQIVFDNYHYNDDKTFDDYSKFDIPDEDLPKYLEELDAKKYVLWINPGDKSEYLLMHPKILPYIIKS